jgi:hypothetical protein
MLHPASNATAPIAPEFAVRGGKFSIEPTMIQRKWRRAIVVIPTLEIPTLDSAEQEILIGTV